MTRPDVLTAEEEVIDRLHGWMFLRYRRWPVTEAELEYPDTYLAPLLPRLHAWNTRLHGESSGSYRQVTAEERAAIKKGRWPWS